MLLGESVNGKPIYNGANHNDHGDPHPQYDKFRTWTTKTITTSSERWVELINGEFQKNPDSLAKNKRAFHKLIYSFLLYNMNNDSEQDVQLVTFICQITNSGSIITNVESRNIFGNPTEFKIFYKKTDNTNSIYDVRLYAKSTQAYTKYKILPIIYDPINNYDAPLHLESVYQGINIKDKLDILHKNLVNNEWDTLANIKTTLEGYTEITSVGDIGYVKAKALSLVNDISRIRFKDSAENQIAALYADKTNKVLKFEGSTNVTKYGFDKTLSPSETNVDLGYNDYRFNTAYLHKLNVKLYNSYAELPVDAIDGDTVLFRNPNTQKYYQLTKLGNKWYGVELTEITF